MKTYDYDDLPDDRLDFFISATRFNGQRHLVGLRQIDYFTLQPDDGVAWITTIPLQGVDAFSCGGHADGRLQVLADARDVAKAFALAALWRMPIAGTA